MTERIEDLEFAAAVRTALGDGPSDVRDDAARALLPFLTATDATVVATATAVLEAISDASDTADVMTELAELAASHDSETAEMADRVLVAITPIDIGGPKPDCPPLSLLVAAVRDETPLPAAAVDHVSKCDYCREMIAAASAAVDNAESAQPPTHPLETVRQVMLTALKAAFTAFVPSEFSPALARDAGHDPVASDVDERASGLLESDDLRTLGLGSSYEYRVLAGDRKGTVTIIVDFEPLDPAVALDAVVQLISSATGETVAQATLRGRGRVRRVTFRNLELADDVWGSLAVAIAECERER